MPDISKCEGKDCPIKENCYRFKAIPNPLWQSYSNFIYDKVKEKCEYFWEIKK